ncbi:cysteine desulfurase family protein [Calderihabitans maritimus]|uniref:Class V aminotransferase n=1 Tax=Calderihabitans maritimus TaxID=1246530 RepID=A0A1Z5HV26_9FIRM|nr:cysteine desulfurase family protein [Calderihabitans maritimus]GAW93362.1 class V aminotransferase [Calderihabitans maritimus]
MREIYLDNSATTRVDPLVVEEMSRVMLENYGNPSSPHGLGVRAEKALSRARRQVASVLQVKPEEIYFTSGGTEANNWAIRGTAYQRRGRGRHLITSAIEHASVLHVFKELEKEGFEVTYLPVNQDGLVEPDTLEKALRPDTILVSIMYVNNEIGSVQPLESYSSILKEREGIVFHVDAVQGFGKLPIHPRDFFIDLLTISAHKLHGPKGVGALYVRDALQIKSLLVGGEQEGNRRAGTENVPGIVGLGKAAELAARRMEEKGDYLSRLKERLVRGLLKIPGTHFNSPGGAKGCPHILNVWFEGIDRGEVLVHMLENRGIYVSTRSACHSRRANPSHVLQAMKKKDEALTGAIRISLSYQNTEEEMEAAAEGITEAVKEFRELKGAG